MEMKAHFIYYFLFISQCFFNGNYNNVIYSCLYTTPGRTVACSSLSLCGIVFYIPRFSHAAAAQGARTWERGEEEEEDVGHGHLFNNFRCGDYSGILDMLSTCIVRYAHYVITKHIVFIQIIGLFLLSGSHSFEKSMKRSHRRRTQTQKKTRKTQKQLPHLQYLLLCTFDASTSMLNCSFYLVRDVYLISNCFPRFYDSFFLCFFSAFAPSSRVACQNINTSKSITSLFFTYILL